MRWLSTLLFLVLAVLPVLASEDEDDKLTGDPIPVEGVITLDLPENIDAMRAGAPHTRVINGVYEGMRVALPTNVDGSCNLDVLIGVQGTGEDRVEFDPDNQHWTQHDIRQVIGYMVDHRTCELVVTRAAAADNIRRRALERATLGEERKKLDEALKKRPTPTNSHFDEQ